MRFWITSTIGLLLVGGLLLAGGMALAQEVVPLGSQFQINTYTGFQQYFAKVASDARGDFVIVWQSLGGSGTDPSGWSIQAQRFNASGTPRGDEFQINSYTTGSQRRPAVAADDLGNFVVVWYGDYQDDPNSGYNGILAQRYDNTGTPVGVEFQVNAFTTHNQIDPSVAADADGNFVVVWDSFGSYDTDASFMSVQAQRYDASGAPLDVQFQVNSYTTSHQVLSAVAIDEDGDFVVIWQSSGSDGSDQNHSSIQAQRYDISGILDGDEFQVNSYTTSHQIRPSVALDAQGNSVVVWNSNGSVGTDTDQWSIQAQRYDSTGGTVGDQFQVNSYTTGRQYGRPTVATDAEGFFVVLWDSVGSYGSDTSETSIQGQLYDISGAAVGNQFQVNTYTTGKQELPAVSSLDASGNFVVVWQSLGSDGSDSSSLSVQAQRFATRAVFVDGFESGDTTSWSSTQ